MADNGQRFGGGQGGSNQGGSKTGGSKPGQSHPSTPPSKVKCRLKIKASIDVVNWQEARAGNRL